MNQNELAIGIDIGGTKIKCGIVDEFGCIHANPRSIQTEATGPRERIVSNILGLVDKVISGIPERKVKGIGIGCTGPLADGVILECNNLPTMHNYPLQHIVETTTGRVVRMDNDANAMIYGEAIWGVGRGRKNILGFTIGTGLGCAIISDGKIYHGHTCNAGEIWQSPYHDGNIEDYASGKGLTNIFYRLTGQVTDGNDIAALARKGNRQAIATFDEFSDALTYAMAWAINVVDPEVVIIGGSVVRSADLFLDNVKKRLAKFITRQAAEQLEILPAQLEENAGFMGAAALMFQ